MQKIPPFTVDLTTGEQVAALSAFQKVLQSGMLTLGDYTAELESAFARLTGSRHAIAVSSGTTALEIILRGLRLDGHVLVPSNTNYATAAAVKAAGLQPVLYDGGIYPDVDAMRSKFTPQTVAVIVVHIGGYISPQMAAIQQFCAEHSLALVEDAAHAHGATCNQGMAGSLGVAAAFSFFPTKVMTTCEGGMITTDDQALAELARTYRDQGKGADGIHNIVAGSSWRMSELHAALGCAQMPAFELKLQHRRQLLQYYDQAFRQAALPDVSMVGQAHQAASGHKAILLLGDQQTRDSLRLYLAEQQVGTSKGVYDVPLHRQPVFQDLAGDAYPVAEDFASRHLCLPLWSGMSQEQAQLVVERTKDFFAGSR